MERGYEVSRGRVGGKGPPTPDTIKHWCKSGKLKARKAGWVWLIAEEELEKLVKENTQDEQRRRDDKDI